MSSVQPSSFSIKFKSSLSLTGVRFTGTELGRGSDAVVVEADHQGTLCAAKKLHQILLEDQSSGGAQRLIGNFENEITTWYSLRHPHIVLLLGVHFEHGSHVPILILEKMQSCLRKYIETYKKEEIPLPDKVFILRQVSQALAYLHSRHPSLVHHDLSPNNILLNQDSLLTKITDFGMSRVVDPSHATRKSSVKGTLAFMSPESLVSPPKYTEKLDIFSFGNITLFTISHLWPEPGPSIVYEGDKVIGVEELQRREQYTRSLTAEERSSFFAMIRSCLENRPDRRPTSLQLVRQMRLMEEAHPRPDLSRQSSTTAQLTQQLKVKDDQLKENSDQLQQMQDQLSSLRKDEDSSREYALLLQEYQRIQQENQRHQEANQCLQQERDVLQRQVDCIQSTAPTDRKSSPSPVQPLPTPQHRHKTPALPHSSSKPILQDIYFAIRESEFTSQSQAFKAKFLLANFPSITDEQHTFLLNLQDDSNSTAPPDYKEACRDVHRFPPAASQDSLRGAVGSNEFEEYFEAKAEQKVLSEMCWFPFGFKTAIFGPEGGVLAIEKEADRNDAGPPGLMYTYVEVPPNSVRDGQHIIIHCGITPFGPFEFPGGHTPCSMIVYLVVRGDTLLKPVYLNNPSWAANEVENGKMRCFVAPHTPSENKFKFEPFDEDSYKASPQSCCITIDGTGCLFSEAIEEDMSHEDADRSRGDDGRSREDADRSRGYDGRPCDRLFLYRCHVFREEAKNIQTKQLLIAFTFNSLAWGKILKKFYHPPSCEYDTSSEFGLSKDKAFFSLKIQAMQGADWPIRVKGVKEVFACAINYWKICKNNPAALKSSVVGRTYPPNLLCVVHQQPPKTMPIDVQVLGPDRNIAYQAIVLYNPPELSQDSLVPRNSRSSTQASLMSTDVDRSYSGSSYVSEASPNSTVSRAELDFGRSSIPHSQPSPIPIAPRRKDVVQELSQDSLVPGHSRSSRQAASLMSTDVDRSCSGSSYFSEASANSIVSRELDFDRASKPHSQQYHVPIVPLKKDAIQVPTAQSPMARMEDKIDFSFDIFGVEEYNKGLIADMTVLGAVLCIGPETEAIMSSNSKPNSQLLKILDVYIAKESPTWGDFCTALKRHYGFKNVREKIERDHNSST